MVPRTFSTSVGKGPNMESFDIIRREVIGTVEGGGGKGPHPIELAYRVIGTYLLEAACDQTVSLEFTYRTHTFRAAAVPTPDDPS